jgi:hypothetical protein
VFYVPFGGWTKMSLLCCWGQGSSTKKKPIANVGLISWTFATIKMKMLGVNLDPMAM